MTPDIDPFFPDKPPLISLPLPSWAPTGSLDDKVWLKPGVVNVPAELWSPEEIHDGSATVDVTRFRNGVAVADLSATGTWCAVCVDPLGGFLLC